MPTKEQVLGEIGKLADNGDNLIRGAIYSKGGSTAAQGQMAANLPEIGSDFKFNEGSVSKVRLGFLGYALDQDEGVNFSLKDNAASIFGQPEFGQYLNARYGEEQGEALGKFVSNLFTQGSENATLGDLLTHRAGVGDLTRDQLRMFQKNGIDTQYSLPDLLLVEQSEEGVKRTNGKPHAQNDPRIPDSELPAGQYGAHQYSNLSYMVAGLAIEFKTGQPLCELHDEYFLHPTKGRAAGREDLNLDRTIPQGRELTDVPKMPAYDHRSESVVDGSKFNGANAAGGFRTTAQDLTKFMEEGFRGFPGTKEYEDRAIHQNQNPYFADDTIDRMMEEGKQFGIAGANQKAGTVDYQMAGFVTTVKVPEGLYIPDTKLRIDGGKEESFAEFQPTEEQLREMFSRDNIVKYAKTGGIVGAKTFAEFNPKEGVAEVQVFLKEDVTPQINRLQENALLQSDPEEAQKMLNSAKNLSSQIGAGERESLEPVSTARGGNTSSESKNPSDKERLIDRISDEAKAQAMQLIKMLPEMKEVESVTQDVQENYSERSNKSLRQDNPEIKGGR
jgi:hypothetical protein